MPDSVHSSALKTKPAPRPAVRTGAQYRLRLTRDAAELRQVQALRFEVFNLELDEGLVESYDTGLDADPFDAQCQHLVVTELASGLVVGTYRMQTGLRAAQGLGYYSEREFDFAPFEAQRRHILELGRACIHRQHRSFTVLNLLWNGVAAYAKGEGARYLLGCSSFTTTDPALGLAAWRLLKSCEAEPAWRTRPLPGYECVAHGGEVDPPHVPRLLSTYLALGAKLCGPPAIDRNFRTVDFLTLLDLQSPRIVALQQRGHFTA